MTTQSIIVYRNPLEAAFWESGMIVPLGGALLAFVLSMVVIQSIAGQIMGRWRAATSDALTTASVIVSAAIAIFVFNYLWI